MPQRPGTERAADDLFPADTRMDAVTLHVRDLDLMTRYYRDALSLVVLPLPDALVLPDGARRAETVVLGRGATPLVVLHRTPDLPVPGRREAGLFHTAVLFDDESGLAHALASVATTAPSTFVGSADHLVSQAFYFTDPEGNGVELYADRPRETWGWDEHGVRMDTLHLDPNAFLAEHLSDASRDLLAGPRADAGERADASPTGPGGAAVGHVHLQVGDVRAARAFYVDTLGFEETATVPGALFVSAGGYHHHMAMNTWNSRGAGPRASSLGLGAVAITVPGADDVGALGERLARAGVATAHDGAVLRFEDPWRNRVEVRAG
ncbi:VOC family protein [Cellulosimicrobium sp. CUA-896]|uniref:VOC family protein n=1 Tax=Cellulosimicrobium sp. CUA-896 TaxID=1517881 RepID=UPI00095C82D6|nr:VOC family protein [Cellulosimicrobium sp. CUA-896]OLT53236.1 glyoxalase [Cellulosimicrobium sp. CUA-896]